MTVLSDHFDTIISGLTSAAAGQTAATLIRDRPSVNAHDFLIKKLADLVTAEDWSDLPE